jgi:pteridine reductase
MNAATYLAVEPAPTPDLLGRWALWMLVLIIILLLMVIGMLSLTFQRRRSERSGSREGGRREEAGERVDAWEESGRRLRLGTDDVGPENGGEDASDAAADTVVGGKGVNNELGEGISSRTEMAAFVASVITRGRRLALVTGGAKRVGRAICLELAQAGCDVMFTYRSSEEEAVTLGEELRRQGAAALAVQVDLVNLQQVAAFADELRTVLPRLDVVVHNASLYEPTPLESLDVSEVVRHVTVNSIAPLIITSGVVGALKHSVLNGGGAVVAMLDIHAMGRPRRGFVGYSMSKAALTELVFGLARELAPHTRVNGVAPGVVAWPQSGQDSTEGEQAAYLRRVPLGRAGTPAEAARVVRWLALEATYVTGQVVRVDGGRWIT